MKYPARFLLAFSNVMYMLRLPFNFSTNFRLMLYLYSKGLNGDIIGFIMEKPENNVIKFLKDENYTLELIKERKENIYGRKD
jgi:hypothetical protein